MKQLKTLDDIADFLGLEGERREKFLSECANVPNVNFITELWLGSESGVELDNPEELREMEEIRKELGEELRKGIAEATSTDQPKANGEKAEGE